MLTYVAMLSSLLKLQIEWDDNEEFYRAWEEARTGYPWIDAVMTQLREQGWMHHLARHAVVRLKIVLQPCICSTDLEKIILLAVAWSM